MVCGRGRRSRIALRTAVAIVAIAVTCMPARAWADPPPHAPAYGWRAKHGHQHDRYPAWEHEEHEHHGSCRGYSGRQWPQDYGIYSGRCNRDAIGAVLGGVVGGAVGSTIGQGSDRAVAILVGGILGAVAGHEIGRAMDERDRACIGQSLELAAAGHNVTWTNEAAGLTYIVTPTGAWNGGTPCRDFRLRSAHASRSETIDARACRGADGIWQMRPL